MRRTKKNHRRRQRSRLGWESLEDRRVLAAGTASIVGGTLTVCGTDAADTIIVAELETNYFVSASFLAESQLFPKTDVSAIRIRGGAGNDTIVSSSLQTSALIEGDAGQDTIFGSSVADRIFGGPDDDLIYGANGNDVIFGNLGADRVFAGAGDDSVFGGPGNDILQGNAGEDTIDGEAGADQVNGSGGNDVVLGGGDNDSVFGGAGDDTVLGQAGDDVVSGDGDHDQVDGGDGEDTVLGGGGNDQLSGGADDDRLIGGNGNDVLLGQSGADTMFGDAGSDQMEGGDGNDLMFGGVGPDILLGNGGDDTLNGGNGADVLVGHGGTDQVLGGEDRDILIGGTYGGSGSGQLNGQGGDDLLVAGTTATQSNPTALAAAREAWADFQESYEDRLESAITLLEVNYLDNQYTANGAGGRDAFLSRLAAQAADAAANEDLRQIIAAKDTYNVAIGDTVTTTSVDGVLANDLVSSGTVTLVTQASHGMVTLNPDGSFSYTQTTYGRDSFVYELTEPSTGQTTRGIVELVVPGLPELPDGATLTTTSSGLEFYDFSVGSGASPVSSDRVNVDYVGYLPNGNIFDSNDEITFSLQNLIAGFTEGVVGMQVGGARRIIIPPDLGYGPNGNPGAGIGGTDTIIFDVTLNAIV